MMCAIDKKPTLSWSTHGSAILVYFSNDFTGLHVVTKNDKLIQGCSGSVSYMIKDKLWMKVRHVNGNKMINALYPIKYCMRVSTHFFLQTWNFHNDNIILGCQIKTSNESVAGVKFFWGRKSKNAHMLQSMIDLLNKT